MTIRRLPESPPGIKAHRRFALQEVTLSGRPMSGATLDVWLDGDRAEQWSARLWIPVAHPPSDGMLEGTGRSGELISGSVRIGDVAAALRRGREMLVEFLGDGPLRLGDAMAAHSHPAILERP